jgi:hypothetical protein
MAKVAEFQRFRLLRHLSFVLIPLSAIEFGHIVLDVFTAGRYSPNRSPPQLQSRSRDRRKT